MLFATFGVACSIGLSVRGSFSNGIKELRRNKVSRVGFDTMKRKEIEDRSHLQDKEYMHFVAISRVFKQEQLYLFEKQLSLALESINHDDLEMACDVDWCLVNRKVKHPVRINKTPTEDGLFWEGLPEASVYEI